MNPDKLRWYLREHPDRPLVNYLVDGFTNGFKLGVTRRPRQRPPCENSAAARKEAVAVQALVDKEVAKGHMLGPFSGAPLPGMV